MPVISYVQAGMWTEIVNAFQHSDAADWLVTSDRHSRESFALTVRGNSMEPDFKEGDVVIIDPKESIIAQRLEITLPGKYALKVR